jgi:sterol 24-C-methyltransferase
MSILAGKSLGDKVKDAADSYTGLFDETKNQQELEQKRKANYTTLVNQYYDLATDFYEFGWGTSFHFAPRFRGEALAQSIARHEHFLALKLKLQPGMKVLDVGCGVGGPMMEIGRFSRAKITGLNNNAYQISRGQRYVEKNGLEQNCDFMKADFMKIPQPDATYDAIYAIEATCHAPSKVGIYSEIFRVLKPGALFAAYEWLMTPKYDPSNAAHNKVKHDIEVGDGLPSLDTFQVALDALRAAGFEIIEYKDLATVDDINPIPWYQPLVPAWSFSGFRLTTIGKMSTHYFVNALEKIGIAPQGSLKTHSFLLAAADGLVKGGQQDIFTPMFFFLVRKPLK